MRRSLRTWLVVGLLVAVAMVGIPAPLARYSSDRTKATNVIELVAGQEA